MNTRYGEDDSLARRALFQLSYTPTRMERVTRLELVLSAWKAETLPIASYPLWYDWGWQGESNTHLRSTKPALCH